MHHLILTQNGIEEHVEDLIVALRGSEGLELEAQAHNCFRLLLDFTSPGPAGTPSLEGARWRWLQGRGSRASAILIISVLCCSWRTPTESTWWLACCRNKGLTQLCGRSHEGLACLQGLTASLHDSRHAALQESTSLLRFQQGSLSRVQACHDILILSSNNLNGRIQLLRTYFLESALTKLPVGGAMMISLGEHNDAIGSIVFNAHTNDLTNSDKPVVKGLFLTSRVRHLVHGALRAAV
mmetsp:Transcript_41995/g.96440  ORF Transcript_41995/g.96440 Transcript_41995/m.96440 type:complete len:239 (-) Transcript_41995:2239-2955(-)